MINLTNHSCYHCQHRNRYERSLHGMAVDRVRRKQKELDEALDKNDLGMVQWRSQQVKEALDALYRFEHTTYSFAAHKYRHRHN